MIEHCFYHICFYHFEYLSLNVQNVAALRHKNLNVCFVVTPVSATVELSATGLIASSRDLGLGQDARKLQNALGVGWDSLSEPSIQPRKDRQ